MLNVSPIYLACCLHSKVADYGLKEKRTQRSPGAGFIGDSVERLVMQPVVFSHCLPLVQFFYLCHKFNIQELTLILLSLGNKPVKMRPQFPIANYGMLNECGL